MKKKLLFFILGVLMSLGAFAQFTDVIHNGSFELPAGGAKLELSTTPIPGWATDDLVTGRTQREGGSPSTLSISNVSSGLYQVVDKIPSTATGYALGFAWHITWDGSSQDTVTLTARLRAFSGSDRKTRKTIDSLNFTIGHTTGNSTPWQRFNGTFLIPEGSSHAGDSLVIDFKYTKWTHNPTENNLWNAIDSVTMLKGSLIDMTIVNGSFELPAGGAKLELSTTPIPGWATDDLVTGRTQREGGSPSSISMSNISSGLYNVIDKIPTTATMYNVNFAWHLSWDGSSQDTVTLTARLRAFSGSDRSTRTTIDSLNFKIGHATGNNTPWESFKGIFSLIPGGSTYQNDSLVLDFKFANWTHNPTENNLWSGIDSVSVFKAGSGPYIPVTSIALSATAHDSVEVLKSIILSSTITPANATNKTVTWAVSDTSRASISSGGILTAKSKLGKVKVIATSQADPTIKGSLDIDIYKVNATSISVSLPDTLQTGSVVAVIDTVFPATTTYKSVRWSVSDTVATIDASSGIITVKDILGFDEDIIVTATSDSTAGVSGSKKLHIKKLFQFAPVVITNPGFERPDDTRGHDFVTDSVPGWRTDDPSTGHLGRETSAKIATNFPGHEGKYAAFSENIATSGIYQAVDKISSDASSYLLTFISKPDYFDGTTDTMYAVVYFSHYKPGKSITTREKIDSAIVSLGTNADGRPLTFAKAPFKISANAAYAGDSLVIEFKQKTMNNGIQTGIAAYGSWAYFDQFALSKLKPVVHTTSIILSFENSDNTLKHGKTGLVTTAFIPDLSTYTDVIWSVSDKTIGSIDAIGNLTGLKVGTVIVTATAKYDTTAHGSISIKITPGTGINNVVTDNDISVYPNPSDGNFTLKAPAASEIFITDVTGKLIYSTKTTNDKTNISLSGTGIYLLKVKTNGSVITKKVIVR